MRGRTTAPLSFLNGCFENDEITRKETKVDLPFQITERCQDGEYSAKSEYPSAEEAKKATAAAKRLCSQNSHAVTVNARNTTMIEIKEEKE